MNAISRNQRSSRRVCGDDDDVDGGSKLAFCMRAFRSTGLFEAHLMRASLG
jgi:hypothetical protein